METPVTSDNVTAHDMTDQVDFRIKTLSSTGDTDSVNALKQRIQSTIGDTDLTRALFYEGGLSRRALLVYKERAYSLEINYEGKLVLRDTNNGEFLLVHDETSFLNGLIDLDKRFQSGWKWGLVWLIILLLAIGLVIYVAFLNFHIILR